MQSTSSATPPSRTRNWSKKRRRAFIWNLNVMCTGCGAHAQECSQRGQCGSRKHVSAHDEPDTASLFLCSSHKGILLCFFSFAVFFWSVPSSSLSLQIGRVQSWLFFELRAPVFCSSRLFFLANLTVKSFSGNLMGSLFASRIFVPLTFSLLIFNSRLSQNSK